MNELQEQEHIKGKHTACVQVKKIFFKSLEHHFFFPKWFYHLFFASFVTEIVIAICLLVICFQLAEISDNLKLIVYYLTFHHVY